MRCYLLDHTSKLNFRLKIVFNPSSSLNWRKIGIEEKSKGRTKTSGSGPSGQSTVASFGGESFV